MRLKIFDGSASEPDCVYLRLAQAEPDHIMLEAVSASGERILDEGRWEMGGVILTVTAKGQISLSPCVFPELGFDLDRDGRVKLDPRSEAATARRAVTSGSRLTRVK